MDLGFTVARLLRSIVLFFISIVTNHYSMYIIKNNAGFFKPFTDGVMRKIKEYIGAKPEEMFFFSDLRQNCQVNSNSDHGVAEKPVEKKR